MVPTRHQIVPVVLVPDQLGNQARVIPVRWEVKWGGYVNILYFQMVKRFASTDKLASFEHFRWLVWSIMSGWFRAEQVAVLSIIRIQSKGHN